MSNKNAQFSSLELVSKLVFCTNHQCKRRDYKKTTTIYANEDIKTQSTQNNRIKNIAHTKLITETKLAMPLREEDANRVQKCAANFRYHSLQPVATPIATKTGKTLSISTPRLSLATNYTQLSIRIYFASIHLYGMSVRQIGICVVVRRVVSLVVSCRS